MSGAERRCVKEYLLALAEERIREMERKGLLPKITTKWTTAGAGEGAELLYCAGARPDGLGGWRPLRLSAQRGHQE